MSQPDSKELAKLLAGKFIERRDVKAVQMRTMDGTDVYYPHRLRGPDGKPGTGPDIPVSMKDLVDHVEYRATFGHYLITPEGTCRIFAFDIDLIKDPYQFAFNDANDLINVEDPRAAWAAAEANPITKELGFQMRAMSEVLAVRSKELLGVPITVHYSGNKGVHVTGLLEPKTSAGDAHEMTHLVLDSLGWERYKGKNFWRAPEFGALHIETFPKQDVVREDGLGNLLRLPLGMNVKSGKKSWFVDMNQPTNKWKQDDPIVAMTEGSIR